MIAIATITAKKDNTFVQADGTVIDWGDVHGQFEDLADGLNAVGFPGGNFGPNGDPKIVFNGDYVDRGNKSIECVLQIMMYKIKYPERVIMLRGNHELKDINGLYGLLTELSKHFGKASPIAEKVYNAFNGFFANLPIAAKVNNNFVCHGGISPDLMEINTAKKAIRIHAIENAGLAANTAAILESIENGTITPEIAEQLAKYYDEEKLKQTKTPIDVLNCIKRPIAITDKGLLADLLWSDPSLRNGFGPNTRGAGYVFGPAEIEAFLKANELKGIVRSHQDKEFTGDVIELAKKGLITVFSAPNYVGVRGNKATYAVMLEDGTKVILQKAQGEKMEIAGIIRGEQNTLLLNGEHGFQEQLEALQARNITFDRLCVSIGIKSKLTTEHEGELKSTPTTEIEEPIIQIQKTGKSSEIPPKETTPTTDTQHETTHSGMGSLAGLTSVSQQMAASNVISQSEEQAQLQGLINDFKGKDLATLKQHVVLHAKPNEVLVPIEKDVRKEAVKVAAAEEKTHSSFVRLKAQDGKISENQSDTVETITVYDKDNPAEAMEVANKVASGETETDVSVITKRQPLNSTKEKTSYNIILSGNDNGTVSFPPETIVFNKEGAVVGYENPPEIVDLIASPESANRAMVVLQKLSSTSNLTVNNSPLSLNGKTFAAPTVSNGMQVG